MNKKTTETPKLDLAASIKDYLLSLIRDPDSVVISLITGLTVTRDNLTVKFIFEKEMVIISRDGQAAVTITDEEARGINRAAENAATKRRADERLHNKNVMLSGAWKLLNG